MDLRAAAKVGPDLLDEREGWERGALVWESREGSNVRERERERDELWNGKRKKIKENNHYFIIKCNKILLLFLGSCYRAQP